MRVSRTGAQCFCSSLRAHAKQSRFFPVSKSRQGAREDKLDCVVASAPRHDETAISGLLQALATPEKIIVQMKLVYNSASSLPRGFLRR